MGKPSISHQLHSGKEHGWIHNLASVSSRNGLGFKSHPSVALTQSKSWNVTAGIGHQMITRLKVVEPAQRKEKTIKISA